MWSSKVGFGHASVLTAGAVFCAPGSATTPHVAKLVRSPRARGPRLARSPPPRRTPRGACASGGRGTHGRAERRRQHVPGGSYTGGMEGPGPSPRGVWPWCCSRHCVMARWNCGSASAGTMMEIRSVPTTCAHCCQHSSTHRTQCFVVANHCLRCSCTSVPKHSQPLRASTRAHTAHRI